VKRCSIIFAGGKTGGHLFPGIAVARKLKDYYGESLNIIFVGLRNGLEERAVPREGWKVEFIPMTTPRTGGVIGIFRFIFYSFPVSFLKSFLIIIKYRPSVIVGLGGYTAFPVALAGWLLFVPVVIMEQNTYMGITNRVLSIIASEVYLSFESKEKDSWKYIYTGNPVRDFVLKRREDESRFVIGILGGSQGAVGLNRLVMKMLPYLTDIKDRIHFIHQTGKHLHEEVKETYRRYGFSADTYEFIDDMGWFYGQVDLTISRAGATTIAELIRVGKPSIFVPFPHAADDHQRKNAEYIADAGGGIVFDENGDPEKLAKIVKELFSDRKKLEEMSTSLKKLYRGDASGKIAERLKKFLERTCLEG